MPFAGQIHYTGRICWSDVRWSLAERYHVVIASLTQRNCS